MISYYIKSELAVLLRISKMTEITTRTYTESGIRDMIPKLAKTLITSDATQSYKSAHIPIYTTDGLRMFLYLREFKSNRTRTTSSSYWRMEIDFGQWEEDHDSEDGIDWGLDRELAEAFGCYMDGYCMSGYKILMPAMNKSLKQVCTGEDVVNELFTTIQRACDAKLCDCGKQFVFDRDDVCFNCQMERESDDDDDSTNDCPICRAQPAMKKWTLTECCEKECHIECLDKCQKDNDRCPFCRSEAFDFAH